MNAKAMMIKLLLKNGTMFTHVNPKVPGVVLPPHIMNKHAINLVWGYNLPLPTMDVTWDNEGLTGTLEFKGETFKVVLPWKAIYAIVNEESWGQTYDKDIPLAEVVPIASAKRARKVKPSGTAQEVGYLRLVH